MNTLNERNAINVNKPNDYLSVINGVIISLYPGDFGKEMPKIKRDKILKGLVKMDLKDFILDLNLIGVLGQVHVANITSAEKFLTELYEDAESEDDDRTLSEFIIDFFKCPETPEYKDLISRLKLN